MFAIFRTECFSKRLKLARDNSIVERFGNGDKKWRYILIYMPRHILRL